MAENKNFIDSLVVSLGLDTKKFKAGTKSAGEDLKKLRETTRKTGQEISRDGDNAAKFYEKISTAFRSFSALSLATSGFYAISRNFKAVADSFIEMGIASQVLDTSARRLEIWGRTWKVIGGTREGLQGSLSTIQKALTSYHVTGGRESADFITTLQTLGISGIADPSKTPRPALDVLIDLVKALRPRPVGEANFFAGRLGLDKGVVLASRETEAEITRLTQAFAQNVAITEASVKVANEFSTQMERVNQALDRGRSLLFDLFKTPAISGAQELAEGLTYGFDQLGKALDIWRRELNGEKVSETSQSRAQRNNNPLNLRYARQYGARNAEGFAAFPSVKGGIQTGAHQLQLYYKRDRLNTIEQIISKFAPPNENDTESYIRFVSKKTGFGRRQSLDLDDRQTLSKLVYAMALMEDSKTPLKYPDILQSVSESLRGNYTSGILQGIKDTAIPLAQTANTTNNHSSEVNIGEIKIIPPDGNAETLASALRPAINDAFSFNGSLS